jgi:3-hydroxyisobutyrate dehydrogenase
MTAQQTIAVLGAGGTMGLPMARNLARAGFAVSAWNRSPEKAEPLVRDGAALCATPAEAASEATAILTMLSDADAVVGTMTGDDGALARAPRSAVWLQMSTVGLEGTDRCRRVAAEHGIAFVDAPVLGTRAPAEERKLVVLASGPDELRDSLQPVFDAISQRTIWVGEAGAGTRLKLATNSWILAVVEGAAETLALAQGLGVDPGLVLDALSGGTLDLPYLQMKGSAMISGDFEPSFRLALAAKDAGLMDDAARSAGLDLPLIATIRRRLEQGAREHGDLDMAATFLTSAA